MVSIREFIMFFWAFVLWSECPETAVGMGRFCLHENVVLMLSDGA